MEEIEKVTCVKFEPRTTEADWINIVNDKEGCFAKVGYSGPDKGAHVLNLQSSLCVETFIVVHELLHSLGVHHEQNRPDRDNYMTINWPDLVVCTNTSF